MAIVFRKYKARDKDACLSLFNENCPEFFAPNEKADYDEFLDQNYPGYYMVYADDILAGVFGIMDLGEDKFCISWIMLSRAAQGKGAGTAMMKKALADAKKQKAKIITISTSHLAYKFFEKFGAEIIEEIEHGWGPNMHKINMIIKL